MVNLDVALEDVISADRGGRRGGKGKGGRTKGSGKASKPAGTESTKRDEHGTDAKLNMTLDDVVAKERPRGKGKGKGKGREDKQEWSEHTTVWSGAKKADGKDATAAKLDMALEDVIEKRPKGKGKGRDGEDKKGDKGHGKSSAGKKQEWSEAKDWGSKSWSDAKPRKEWQDDDDSWGGRPTARRVEWQRSGGDSWGEGWSADRERAEDLKAENARLQRELSALKRAAAEGGKGGDPYDSWRNSASSAYDEGRPRGDGGGAPKRARVHEEPAPRAARSTSGGRRIKVTNLPRDLDWRDIKDAFEAEAGKVSDCEVNGNMAWITFVRAADALKAVDTFDRGELNGRCIGVTLEA